MRSPGAPTGTTGAPLASTLTAFFSVGGGERFQDVIERVDEFLSELPGEDNLLITHSGVIKACWALRGVLSVEIAAKKSMDFGDYLCLP